MLDSEKLNLDMQCVCQSDSGHRSFCSNPTACHQSPWLPTVPRRRQSFWEHFSSELLWAIHIQSSDKQTSTPSWAHSIRRHNHFFKLQVALVTWQEKSDSQCAHPASTLIRSQVHLGNKSHRNKACVAPFHCLRFFIFELGNIDTINEAKPWRSC